MAELEYGTVVGQYRLVSAGTSRAAQGVVRFTPVEPDETTDFATVYTHEAFNVTLNGDGWLRSEGGQVDQLRVPAGRWEVTFRNVPGLTVKPFQFDVPAGETVILPQVQPLIPSPAVKFVVNEQVYTETLAARVAAEDARDIAVQAAEDATAPTEQVVDARIDAKRNAANGLAPLGPDSKVPLARIPVDAIATSAEVGAVVDDALEPALTDIADLKTETTTGYLAPAKVAPLVSGKLPEANVPDRLTEPALSATFAGLGGILWYDDFSRYADGAITGQAPLIGESAWSVTGAQPPVVSGGALVSSGVGYAYANMGVVPDLMLAEVEWVNPGGASPFAMSWVTGESWGLTNLTNHANIGPLSEYTTVKRSDTFYPLFPQRTWRNPMRAGERYIVAVAMIGNQVMIAANGDIHSSPPDPRVSELAGPFVFWEPITSGGSSARIHRVAAFKFGEEDMLSSLTRLGQMAGVGNQRGANETLMGSPFRQSEVAIGDVNNDGTARVRFGSSEVRTTVSAAAAAGATSIQLAARVPSGTVVQINPGLPGGETVTTSGYPTGTGPYVHTVTALANGHAAGEVVSAAPASNRRADMYMNMSNGYFYLPGVGVLVAPSGNLYLGDTLDAYLSRFAAGIVGSNGPFRPGRFATASRPNLTGQAGGPIIYDTTLNKAIMWNGTEWRNLDGSVLA